MKANKRMLANVFGVSHPTVAKWVDRGCPCERGEQELVFQTEEVMEWLYGEPPTLKVLNRRETAVLPERLDPEQEMARKNKELADKAALENAISRRELIHQDDVAELEKSWGEHIMAAKAKLLGIGGALAPTLAGEQEPAKVKEEVDSAVRQALRELTTDD